LRGLTAARAAERATPAEVAELRQIIQEMRDAAAAELLRYSDANARLHGLVRGIAAHQTATGIIERLRAQLVRHQFALSLVPGRPAVSLEQHERIVAAIAAGDRDPAEAAMRDHITSVIDALRNLPPDQVSRARTGTEAARRQ
jgi:DNA-binding GntR family transcriptional regulator